MQLPFTAKVAPQLFFWEKSPEFVPVIVIPEIVRLPGPTFLIVTFLAVLVVPTLCDANVRLVGLTLTMVPVPLRETPCGLLAASSAKLNVAVRVPAAWGVNITLTVHVDPAASVAPQLFDEIPKSAALVPPMVLELIFSVVLPLFRTVTYLADEALKSRTIPKFIDVVDSFTIGEIPVPLNATL